MGDGICKRILLEKKYVDTFIEWNKIKTGIRSQKHDIRFIRLLLLLSCGIGNLVNGELHDAVKQWVHGRLNFNEDTIIFIFTDFCG